MDARQVSQAKIGNYEQQKSPRFPRKYRYFLREASGTRRVIYISPCTYLPTYPSHVLRESIQPFLRHWRNAREGGRGDEEARRLQGGGGPNEGSCGHFFSLSCSFGLFHSHKLRRSFFLFHYLFRFLRFFVAERGSRAAERTSQNRIRQLRSW